jgi:large subunit ribosomal protein L10
MPLSRQQKEQLVESYQEGLAAAPHVFLISYKGISVPQVTELRRRIRDIGATYAVVKNRLVLRAIGGKAIEDLKGEFQGATAVAFSNDDPVSLAKTLTEFAKEVPALEFKTSLVEGRPVEAQEVEKIASLPSREELITKLVFLLQSPVTSFVRTLAALPRQFVVVLDQIRQQKEGSES